uniref:hypothetical protein n=1 Tax=Herbidospora sakaeratensis TaxID=564415 RepID=UPI0007862A54|nr:hypothetical protein [Herbidospora sakaeratensis]
MSRDGDGQTARARRRILEFWQHNRGPLSGSFSIIDAYLVLFRGLAIVARPKAGSPIAPQKGRIMGQPDEGTPPR